MTRICNFHCHFVFTLLLYLLLNSCDGSDAKHNLICFPQ